MSKIKLFDGQKAVTLTGDEGWAIHGQLPDRKSADYLYSVISWMYRCVTVRANGVAAMPFEIRRGDDVVYEYDGMTAQNVPPTDLDFALYLPVMLGKVEAANTLGGKAYIEKRFGNRTGRVMGVDWLLPWSIYPQYNGLVSSRFGQRYDPSLPKGDLLGFWRDLSDIQLPPVWFEPDELLYFWMPDYSVEMGPSSNYPGRAVLQNAGVVANMDLFLAGYFKRGMIKATLLKYKDRISDDQAKQVKSWWKRVATGIDNAWATLVVRGDFETMIVGEGIKELRDNQLMNDEKKDIAVGMGVPLSKVDSTASTDSNRDADDVQFIEQTVIPEIQWIYAALNEQLFAPMGYRIIAKPQTLRVMQTDEVKRAQAFSSYVGSGMSIDAAINILGIYVPEDVELESPDIAITRQQIQGQLSEEAALAQANQEAGGDVEKLLLNGVQITAALQIVEKYAQGLFPRENAIEMYNAFLGIDPSIGAKLIPATTPNLTPPEQPPLAQQSISDMDIIQLLEKQEEIKRFQKWVDKREQFDVADFKSDLLTEHEKVHIAIDRVKAGMDWSAYKAITQRIDDYVEDLAGLVLALSQDGMSRDEMIDAMTERVRNTIITEFKQGAGIADDEDLTPVEMNGLNEVLTINLQSVPKFVDATLQAFEKGVLLDTVRDSASSIGNRLTLWGNALREALNLGRIFNRDGNKVYEWRLGQTEEHCRTCLAQNGQKRTSTEWRSLAGLLIYPQSRALDCKGFNCDCGIYEV